MPFRSSKSLALRTALDDVFDEKTLRRGEDYYYDGHVLWLEAEDGKNRRTVTGQVRGSGHTPYTTVLELSIHAGQLEFDHGQCTCPVGVACKHTAALLLAFADHIDGIGITRTYAAAMALPNRFGEHGRITPATATATVSSPPVAAPPTAWNQWFKTASEPSATTPLIALRFAKPVAERRLAFVFGGESTGVIPALKVRPIWQSRLKSGAWGSPETVQFGYGDAANIVKHFDAEQLALIAGLRLFAPYYGSSQHMRLDGPQASDLLTRMLASQACYWDSQRQPIAGLGETIGLTWQWQTQANGSQHLRPQLGKGVQLLRADTLWYLDFHNLRIGRVDHDLALAERLLRTPALAPEHIEHVNRLWLDDPHLASLPPPKPMPTVRVITGPPQPVVRMQPISAVRNGYPGYRETLTVFVARLAFQYGDQRVASGTHTQAERRLVEGGLVTIQRDAQAERQACDALRAGGVVPALAHPTLQYLMRELATPADWLPRESGHPEDPLAVAMLAPRLLAAGFAVEYDETFPIELLPAPDEWYGQIDEPTGMDWFGVELGIVLDGDKVSLLPILAKAIEDRRFPLHAPPDEAADAVWYAPIDARRRVPLPLARVREWLAPLLEWLNPHTASARVPRLALDVLADLQARSGQELPLHGGAGAQALGERLRNAGRELTVSAPAGLVGSPRPYQLDGLRWLQFLADARLGGVLADDMGLGKTLQILMHLLAEKQAARLSQPALVVCPTSVIGNWQEQAQRFAPELRVLVLHGLRRGDDFARIGDHDLVITTYSLLARDRVELLKQHFALAVFDEAQAIKNPLSQAALVARALPVQRRLAVTGTPLENHLGELWAQFDCVLPGLLGSREHFNRHFRTPIEKHADGERQQRLNRRIAPFMLRRNKEAVAPELPPKTVIERQVELTGGQRELYETLRLAMHERVREALGKRGMAQSSIVILDALLKLRQVCCDPRLIKLDGQRRRAEPPPSAKLGLLHEMLAELREEGRRVLLFSQFTGMLDLIEADLKAHRRDFVRLDGSTTDRASPIRRFQSGEVPLFLISLKAGGVGLNLTAADTVIHYDPWWNPATENQATDRAHRIGQDKPVFVYKLTCTGTVEEKIQALQKRKAELAQAVLEGGARTALRFTEEDIADLFAPVG